MSLSQQLKEEEEEEEGLNQPIQQVSTVPIRRKIKRQILNPSLNTGHWSQQEHQTYLDFLQQHKEIMESQDQKKSNKVFKQMSEIIGSRSPSQCRSHHQKFNPFIHQVKKRQKGQAKRRITKPLNQSSISFLSINNPSYLKTNQTFHYSKQTTLKKCSIHNQSHQIEVSFTISVSFHNSLST